VIGHLPPVAQIAVSTEARNAGAGSPPKRALSSARSAKKPLSLPASSGMTIHH
jgi:hypothetical protein